MPAYRFQILGTLDFFGKIGSLKTALRRSAFNPTNDQLLDRAVLLFSDISMSLAWFLFWTVSSFLMYLGDYSPCVGELQIVGP